MRLRSLASVSPRQSLSSVMRASIRWEGEASPCPSFEPLILFSMVVAARPSLEPVARNPLGRASRRRNPAPWCIGVGGLRFADPRYVLCGRCRSRQRRRQAAASAKPKRYAHTHNRHADCPAASSHSMEMGYAPVNAGFVHKIAITIFVITRPDSISFCMLRRICTFYLIDFNI